MKVQIIGAGGMLGSAVAQAARQRGLDVWDQSVDLEVVTHAHIRAGVVINCAGLVKQRKLSASRFMLVNAYGPHHLAEAAIQAGARVIQVSTDCVFQQSGPHWECSVPDAADVYARSKLAGELAAPHLTVRTSFVGPGPRGLVADLMSGQSVRASNRLLWSGHTVETVADVLLDLAARDDVTGLLHIPGDQQTRYELASALALALGAGAGAIVRDDEYRADRRLCSDRWAELGLPVLPSFADQLRGAAWTK